MDKLDQIYLALLLLSIPYGHFIRTLTSAKVKRFFCLVAGLFILFSLVGLEGSFHSFVVIIGNYFLVVILQPRHFQYYSFVLTFSYLLFYRCCTYLGFPVPPKHSNAVQLLVTIRMISLSFELHDAGKKTNIKDDPTLQLKIKKELSASLFDFFTYGYCYIGLMTGPFYTYQCFQDMLYQDGRTISTLWPTLDRVKILPILAVPYLILKANFPLEYLESRACLEHPYGLFHILPTMTATYNWYRWRYLIGWLLAETMCVTAGLGAYPFECRSQPGVGPLEPIPENFDPKQSFKQHNGHSHDFRTIHNIDVYEVETCNSMKTGMKIWNKTVQWWMANYVYKKLPFKSKRIRLGVLLLISAYWHGVHPGYYIAFFMVFPCVIAETLIESAVQTHLTTDRRKLWWYWIKWFIFFRYMDFTAAVPFMYLKFDTIWKIYSRVYFMGLVIASFVIMLSFVIPKHKKPQ